MGEYHDAVREIKGEHFNSMKYHKSADPDLKNRGLLRILEIGAGPGKVKNLKYISKISMLYNLVEPFPGGNFEFYPPNSRLTVVEPNAFFEPNFYERQSKFPALKMEKFIVAKAEDMKEIPDNSFDIVVSTLVLCSVDSVEQTAKEVQRVLAPVNICL